MWSENQSGNSQKQWQVYCNSPPSSFFSFPSSPSLMHAQQAYPAYGVHYLVNTSGQMILVISVYTLYRNSRYRNRSRSPPRRYGRYNHYPVSVVWWDDYIVCRHFVFLSVFQVCHCCFTGTYMLLTTCTSTHSTSCLSFNQGLHPSPPSLLFTSLTWCLLSL